jgi:hypothetical protein
MQDELAALKEFVTNWRVNNMDKLRKLMEHLIEKHPPKNTAHTAGDISDDNLKKTVLATIMHYHTDKQVREPFFASARRFAAQVSKL